MGEETILLEVFRRYLSLSQKIKGLSRDGDLDSLLGLLGEREELQEEIQALLHEYEGHLSIRTIMEELLAIVDDAKEINDDTRDLLLERKRALAKELGDLKKGQKVASSYSVDELSFDRAYFFDKQS